MIDSAIDNIDDVISIFHKYPQLKVKVYAFGSRVKGTARKNSDLDLIIKSELPIALNDLYDIKDTFSESDILYRVDLSDWSRLSDSFKEAIEHELVLIYESS